ncbi:transposase [Flavobacterium sp. RSP29]|uniref:transposase n=1 Tax=Flavobacterium sp. RSP29 TaxID=3401731 RepID=UPI003AAC0824
MSELARELGVTAPQLYKWRKEFDQVVNLSWKVVTNLTGFSNRLSCSEITCRF